LPAGVRIRRKFLYTKKLCELSVLGGEKYGLGKKFTSAGDIGAYCAKTDTV
jgi:hypothetical protein